MSCASSICCSLASCFGCRFNAKLAKLVYFMIFLTGSILAVVLRYWGQEALQSWVPQITSACNNGQCYGAQAVYRVSWSLAVFFAIMTVCVAIFPITHLGGWLVKVMLWVLLLGLSLLINNGDMQRYAEAARVFSVLFQLAQCLIVIDFAYKLHEWLMAKADEADAHAASEGWEQGLLSNVWKVLYVVLSVGCVVASIVGCALMYNYFASAKCPLDNFFISQTLVIGVVLTLVSLHGAVGKGLLPPAFVFLNNTYLTYGAITNNPDPVCNQWGAGDQQNGVAIIIGLIIAIVSIAWMAYASAGGMYAAVSMSDSDHHHAASTGGGGASLTTVPVSNPATAAAAPAGAAAGYQAAAVDDEETGADKSAAGASSGSAADSGRRAYADDDTHKGVEPRPWVFHVVMFLGGCYIAMMATNWGSPTEASAPSPVPGIANGNPELSLGSMWARMGALFAIEVLFAWTLVAPLVCKNRDFGR